MNENELQLLDVRGTFSQDISESKFIFTYILDLRQREHEFIVFFGDEFYFKNWNKYNNHNATVADNIRGRLFRVPTFVSYKNKLLCPWKEVFGGRDLKVREELTGLNFINVLRTAFTLPDPKSIKIYLWLNCIFYAFGIYERKSCM